MLSCLCLTSRFAISICYILFEWATNFFTFIAMPVGDDVMEGSIESKQNGDVHSLEDVAWADSCLVKDSEISDSSWDSLKNALLEIGTSQSDSVYFSSVGGDDFPGVADIEILSSSEAAQSPLNLERTVDDAIPSDEEVEQNDDSYKIHEKIDKLKLRAKLRYPFLPTYSEEPREIDNTESGLDSGFSVSAMEPSGEEIFRVWDLNIAAEEDELIKQLNKAVAESSSQPLPSISTGAESLDDLTAGISGLSLEHSSG